MVLYGGRLFKNTVSVYNCSQFNGIKDFPHKFFIEFHKGSPTEKRLHIWDYTDGFCTSSDANCLRPYASSSTTSRYTCTPMALFGQLLKVREYRTLSWPKIGPIIFLNFA